MTLIPMPSALEPQAHPTSSPPQHSPRPLPDFPHPYETATCMLPECRPGSAGVVASYGEKRCLGMGV